MIKVKQNMLSASKHSLKATYKMEAEYITFHNTANDASAENEIKYMLNNNSSTSYHFAIDDKEVVQGIPTNRNAWHCGDGGSGTGNRKSIGVEICYSKSGGERYKKAEELGIRFIAQLLFERNWNVDRVKPHKHWSGKNCPHRILDEKRWDSVLKRISSELQNLRNKAEVKKTDIPQQEEVKGVSKVKQVVSETHKEAWEWAKINELMNGENPKNPLTREQFATVLKRLYDDHLNK